MSSFSSIINCCNLCLRTYQSWASLVSTLLYFWFPCKVLSQACETYQYHHEFEKKSPVPLSHLLWAFLEKDLLTRVKIPCNKGRHCQFQKSQLDSQTFSMAGPTGLWTHYHLGGDLNRLSSTNKKRVPAGFILL